MCVWGVLYVLCVPICIYACMLAMPQLAQNSCRSWCSLLVSASVGFPSGYWLTSLWESCVSASHLYIGCADVHHHMWLFVGSGDQMQDVGLAWCVFLSTVFFQGQYFRDLFSLQMTKFKGSEIESLLQFQWPRAHHQCRRIMSSLPPHSSQVQWSRLVCCCLWYILERGQVESCGFLFQFSGGLWAAAFSSLKVLSGTSSIKKLFKLLICSISKLPSPTHWSMEVTHICSLGDIIWNIEHKPLLWLGWSPLLFTVCLCWEESENMGRLFNCSPLLLV